MSLHFKIFNNFRIIYVLFKVFNVICVEFVSVDDYGDGAGCYLNYFTFIPYVILIVMCIH